MVSEIFDRIYTGFCLFVRRIDAPRHPIIQVHPFICHFHLWHVAYRYVKSLRFLGVDNGIGIIIDCAQGKRMPIVTIAHKVQRTTIRLFVREIVNLPIYHYLCGRFNILG